MYASGEASGVSHMLCLGYSFFVDFGETIYVVIAGSLKSEVLCQVDNLHVFGYGVLLEESLALAVPEAEENNIHLVERHLRSELHVAVAIQSFMHLSHRIASIALAIGEDNLSLGMIYKKADEFATGIAGGTKNTYTKQGTGDLLGIIQYRMG